MIQLSSEDFKAVSDAVRDVQDKAMAVGNQSDTEAMRRALLDARDAILTAADTLTRAEENVRYRISERS